MLLADDFGQPHRRRARFRASSPADQQGHCLRQGHEVLQQRRRGLVSPVPVLKDKDEGALPGQPLKEHAGCPEDLPTDRLGIQILDPLGEIAANLEAKERRDVREHLGELIGE